MVLDNPHDPACIVEMAGAPGDLVVIDHYQLDVQYEEAMRSLAATRFVFEDVPGRRHEAEILLDAAFGRSAEAYRDLVPEACRLLLGPKFALLAPEFGERRQGLPANGPEPSDVSKVFVCFGGVDGKKLVIDALKALDLIDEHLSVDVAIGAGARHLPDIFDIAERSHQDVTIHEDCSHVPELLANADIALGAGGINAWERCVLGVPSIVACAAGNQRDVCSTLVSQGVALGIVEPGKGTVATMKNFLDMLIENAALRDKMRDAALRFCDGLGVRHIVSAIEETVSQNAI